MQGIKPETLSDEEFMRYAYMQGLSKLDETWVKQLYDRLQRMMDAQDALDASAFHDKVINADYNLGYRDGFDAATK
jgi:hypothetical protein